MGFAKNLKLTLIDSEARRGHGWSSVLQLSSEGLEAGLVWHLQMLTSMDVGYVNIVTPCMLTPAN